MKQFNARLSTETIATIGRLQEAMATARGLPKPLSQAAVMEMAITALAETELAATKRTKTTHKGRTNA